MLAIIGGLGAASAWGCSTVCSSRSTRMIGPGSVLAWVMLVGLVALLPALVAEGPPAGLDGPSLAWLALSGAGNVGGLLLGYAALKIGKVSIVAPILATEGGIAALLAVAAGEQLSAGAGATLVVIATGIVLAAATRDPPGAAPADRHPAAASVLAAAASLAFGVSLYATARAGADVPVAWVLLPARLIGVLAVLLPLMIAGGLRLTRTAVPLVVASGLCEVIGFVSFTLGARHGIAVAAVLASQFAAVAVAVALYLFGERLARVQLAGIVAILGGVAALTLLQA